MTQPQMALQQAKATKATKVVILELVEAVLGGQAHRVVSKVAAVRPHLHLAGMVPLTHRALRLKDSLIL